LSGSAIFTTRPKWLFVCADPAVEKVARELCYQHHHNRDAADRLEPGNTPFMDDTKCIDGELHGEPAFFRWRQFVPFAYQLVQIARQHPAPAANG
jgi:hypothetical protein